MARRTATKEEGSILMTEEEIERQERRQFKIELAQAMLEQWVNDGMTMEEARKLWAEFDEHSEAIKTARVA